jgi:hypothetical protein
VNEVVCFLAEHGASGELEEFAAKYRSLIALWEQCPRVEWLLWMLEKLKHRNRRELRLFACWCARSFWPLMGDERSRCALVTSERFARGDATKVELQSAQYAAVKAAKDATLHGDKAAAWAAWIACAAAMHPSLEAAKHVVQRSAMALRETSAQYRTAPWARMVAQQPDRLREIMANPFNSTRADSGYDTRHDALAPWAR